MGNPWLISIENSPPPGEEQTMGYVSVPGELVCTRLIALPTLPQRNREAVIAYALEDQFASDLDEIKLIASPTNAEGKTTVLWCLRRHYEDWLKRISNWPLVQAVLPDYLFLPFKENSWTLVLDENRCLLRTGETTGLAIEKDWLVTYLENETHLPQQITSDSNELCEILRLFCEKNKITLSLKELKPVSVPTNTELSLLPKSPWNWLKKWKVSFILAVIWLLLGVVGFSWQTIAVRKKINEEHRQLMHLYHEIEPHQALPSDPVVQLKHLERQLRLSVRPDPVLQSLSFIADLIHKKPELTLQSFDAQENKLSFELTSTSQKALDLFLTDLKKINPSVKQSKAILHGDNTTTLTWELAHDSE